MNLTTKALVSAGDMLLERRVINHIESVTLREPGVLNAAMKKAGLEPGWSTRLPVGEMQTATPTNWLRLHGPNMEGSWMTLKSEATDAAGNFFNSGFLKNKFGLKYPPLGAADVDLAAGSTIRTGFAGEVPAFNATGGGFQLEVLSTPSATFTPAAAVPK